MSSARAVLIHLVDGPQEDIGAAYKTIRDELAAYGEDWRTRPRSSSLTRSTADADEIKGQEPKSAEARPDKAEVMTASGVSGAGRAGRPYIGVISVLDERPRQDDDREAVRRKAEPDWTAVMANALAPPLSAADHQDRLGNHR